MSLRYSLLDSARALLSPAARQRALRWQRRLGLNWPRRGAVRFGSFHRTSPISHAFGLDRGQPVDRYYIESFLSSCRDDVRGRALELGDATYIRRYGGDRVEQIDVLHVTEGNPQATIVADLTEADHIPSDTFDCIIFTQSLQMIYDMPAAMRHLHRILRPGGVLLLTSHGISRIGRRRGRDDWGEYWRITTQGAERLLAEAFAGGSYEVRSYGNVLSALCFLHGLATEELTRDELDHHDPDFEVIVAARAVKGGRADGTGAAR